MPLDGTHYKPKIKPLETGLAGLKQLGDALRGRLPDNFFWRFDRTELLTDCGTYGCALGVAHTLWPAQIRVAGFDGLAGALGFPVNDFLPLFGGIGMHDSGIYGGKTHAQITPTDVADAIDRYIAGKEHPHAA